MRSMVIITPDYERMIEEYRSELIGLLLKSSKNPEGSTKQSGLVQALKKFDDIFPEKKGKSSFLKSQVLKNYNPRSENNYRANE
tara:strand:+ start:189 stop:440 length:252 start_codon:yes stop_codon:yes gene_type:complete